MQVFVFRLCLSILLFHPKHNWAVSVLQNWSSLLSYHSCFSCIRHFLIANRSLFCIRQTILDVLLNLKFLAAWSMFRCSEWIPYRWAIVNLLCCWEGLPLSAWCWNLRKSPMVVSVLQSWKSTDSLASLFLRERWNWRLTRCLWDGLSKVLLIDVWHECNRWAGSAFSFRGYLRAFHSWTNVEEPERHETSESWQTWDTPFCNCRLAPINRQRSFS